MKIDIRNNELSRLSEDQTRFSHKALSTSFKVIELLPDGRILVLEDYYQFEYIGKSNLYCLNRDLEIAWFLDFPYERVKDTSNYTSLTVKEEGLFANTFDCTRVKFATDGKILQRKSVK